MQTAPPNLDGDRSGLARNGRDVEREGVRKDPRRPYGKRNVTKYIRTSLCVTRTCIIIYVRV